MIKMIMHEVSGVRALMTEEHYRIFKECYVPEGESPSDVAFALGVRWYVFILHERTFRSPTLAGLVTATWEDLERWKPKMHVTPAEIFVPLCSGPLYWNEEGAKFVGTYSAFMGLVTTAYANDRPRRA